MPKIISTKPLGLRPTCDIEVMHPDHQFYLANGLLTSNSAHAKAYGMLTMQTAYLRTYHPLEFFAALLSCGQASELQEYVDDIRKQGFKVLPVDVNISRFDHTMEGDGIRLALSSVKDVGAAAVVKIVAGQPYSSFIDFIDRSGVNKSATEALIKTGAFHEIEPNMGLLMKRFELCTSDPKLRQKKRRPELERLYAGLTAVDFDQTEKMQLELEQLGFNLRSSPFTVNGREEKVQMLLDAEIAVEYHDFIESDASYAMVPVVVKSFKERPQKNKQMFAFVKFADRNGMEFEAPCFSAVWQHVKGLVRPGEVYVVMFNHNEDEPSNLVVGKPGWGHKQMDALGYFLRIDEVTR